MSNRNEVTYWKDIEKFTQRKGTLRNWALKIQEMGQFKAHIK